MSVLYKAMYMSFLFVAVMAAVVILDMLTMTHIYGCETPMEPQWQLMTMVVATYKTATDMPEHLRNALPSQEELINLIKEE